eukprot:XP_015578568.1 uncharacterized protein LOC107261745 [Ricinus communis]
MAKNNYQWHTTRSRMGGQGSVHQLDATAALAAQVELLSKKLDQLQMPEDSGRKDGDSKVMELEKIEAKKKSPLREYQPPIPYPARLKQEKMPKYVKFLKEIFSNNRKLEDLAIVTLNEECSAILQTKLLEKKHDPGSFTVPCVIGNLTISNALTDLGARINLMSYGLFTKLGLGKMKPTRISIQLVDRTIKYPRGIVEDILIKVDKFIFPIDFMIMDMDGESNIPLIPSNI